MEDILPFRSFRCQTCNSNLRFDLLLDGHIEGNTLVFTDHDKEAFARGDRWYCPNGCLDPMPQLQLRQLAESMKPQLLAAILDYGRAAAGIEVNRNQ